MTNGNLAPTGPMAADCISVPSPDMNNVAWMIRVLSAGLKPSASATTSGAAMVPAKIASMCWSPRGNACSGGSLPWIACSLSLFMEILRA